MKIADSRKWWALAAITLSVLAVGLDVTVLSVALPTLAVALKASESDLQWFSSAYAMILAAGMLPSGVLGDRFGRKRILLAALVLFAAGSICCAFSVSPGQLKTVPTEQSGVASAMIQAMQKVGFPLGAAIVGSVLVTAYRSQLTLTGLPAAAAEAVKGSVFAGVAVAEKIHSTALLESVRSAFVAGLDAALVASAATAAIAMILALIFLPGRTAPAERAEHPAADKVA